VYAITVDETKMLQLYLEAKREEIRENNRGKKMQRR